MAEPITNSMIKADVRELLKGADLTQTSSKKIRKQLEEKYGVDLIDRKQDVDAIVMELLHEGSEDDSSDDEQSDSEDEKPAVTSGVKPEGQNSLKREVEETVKREVKGSVKREVKDSVKQETEDSDDSSDDEPEDTEPITKKPRKSGDAALAEALQDAENGRRSRGCKKPPKKEPTKVKPKKDVKAQKQFELTPALAEIMGRDRMARSEVVKRMWEIVKERNLQDPKNRQFMICDEPLQKVFGRKRVRTFGMMKFLKDHMYKPGERDQLFTS